jgi:hypothetical protein
MSNDKNVESKFIEIYVFHDVSIHPTLVKQEDVENKKMENKNGTNVER